MNKIMTAAIALCFMAGTAAFAQTKPDFSGDWKLNKDKSDFGPMPAPSAMTQKIDHKDPDLKVVTHIVGGQQGEVNYETAYTTDGKECLNQFGGQVKTKSKLTWDGAVLLINTEGDYGTMQINIKGKWTLSADGKTLTQTAHVETPQGAIDTTYSLEKQ